MAKAPQPGDEAKIVSDALAGQIVQNTKLHLNLAQDAIVITEDKVRLCLMRHLQLAEAKRGWIAPAGVLLTIAATFATTTFHDYLVQAATWQAIFIVAGILDIVWLIRAITQAVRAPEIEDIVGEMKAAGAKQASEKSTS